MEKIIIFGATGGIGSAVAKKLTEQGRSVVLCARNEGSLAELSTTLQAEFHLCDVTDESQVEEVFSAVSRNSKIVGVALCVGSILLKPVHLISLQEWLETITKNLTTAFLICKYSAKYMQDGAVLLFSSGAAQIGLPYHEAIAAAKSGVEGLVRSAAATYASRGLRFNGIAPGLVRTGLSKKILSSSAGEKSSIAYHGLGRLGEPEDIAGIASWLLTEKSSWVTGHIYNIDGGLTSIKKVPS